MICPKCQTAWPDELKNILKFCGACGAPMDGEPAASEPAASKPASEPLLDPPAPEPGAVTAQPGGELRFVTVVFADLAGFTAFAEDRAPDEVAKIVGDLLQRLGQVVENNGGAVDKFLGDAVVATFGLPRPDPHAARNAVRAGLAMQAAADAFNQEYGLNFGLRVGIHAGEVMFRAIGGSWTVMGDTVNTASRIQSATTPGKVWISRPVYEEVHRFFVLLPRPAVELKGKKHAVQPYEVVEERRVPFVNLPPFVGREDEWNQILEELQGAVRQQTLRVVVLRGSAGVGKSRLAWELRDWIQRQSEIYRVNVVQFDAGERLPSHGLNTLVRSRFDLPLELDGDALLDRLRERMPVENPASGGRLDLAAELFAFILGISRPGFRTASMDGKNRWDSAFIELKAWLESQAGEEPFVWFLEDAQKGDSDTAAFVDWALRMEWRVPALILVTLREEDFGPECYWYPAITRWIKTGQVREIRLKEISQPMLAKALVGMLEGELAPELAQRIAEHTEGNPLFAIELTMLLKERGQLQEGFEQSQPLLPGSVREVMEARIERLGQDGKEVAKRGSLIGRRFTREAIERIWDRRPAELESGYLVLYETETVYEEVSRLFIGMREDVFRHGRLHEAVLARIPRDERLKWLKELEACALARLGQEENRLAAGALLIPLIARSREEQHDAWQASLWYEVLGLLHIKSYRVKEAVQAFREAAKGAQGTRRLVLAHHVAEGEVFSGEGEKALLTIAAARDEETQAPGGPCADGTQQLRPQPLDPMPLCPQPLRQMLDELLTDPLTRWERLTAAEASAALELKRGTVLTNLGRVEEARQVFQQLGPELEGLKSEAGRRLLLRWGRAWAYLLSELIGRQQEAEAVCQHLRRHAELRDPALADEWNAFLATEGMMAYRLGRYTQAQAIADERLRYAEAHNDLPGQSQVWNTKGIIAHLLADLDAAAEGYGRAREISRMIGERRGEVIGLYNLAGITIDQGKLEQAAQLLEQYLALSRLTGNRLAEAYAPLSRSGVELERGRYDLAETHIRQAIQAAEQNDWPALVDASYISLAVIDLYRWLDGQDPAGLDRAVQTLQAKTQASPEDIEPESYALLILALFFAGKTGEAQSALQRLRQRQDASWVSDRWWLELAEAVTGGQPLDGVCAEFHTHGFTRAERFIGKLQRMSGLT